jgi:hypothetical protein
VVVVTGCVCVGVLVLVFIVFCVVCAEFLFLRLCIVIVICFVCGARGGAVVEALRYKPENRGSDS